MKAINLFPKFIQTSSAVKRKLAFVDFVIIFGRSNRQCHTALSREKRAADEFDPNSPGPKQGALDE